jgi:ABC-type anion transport system duplicated permease subunit
VATQSRFPSVLLFSIVILDGVGYINTPSTASLLLMLRGMLPSFYYFLLTSLMIAGGARHGQHYRKSRTFHQLNIFRQLCKKLVENKELPSVKSS